MTSMSNRSSRGEDVRSNERTDRLSSNKRLLYGWLWSVSAATVAHRSHRSGNTYLCATIQAGGLHPQAAVIDSCSEGGCKNNRYAAVRSQGELSESSAARSGLSMIDVIRSGPEMLSAEPAGELYRRQPRTVRAPLVLKIRLQIISITGTIVQY